MNAAPKSFLSQYALIFVIHVEDSSIKMFPNAVLLFMLSIAAASSSSDLQQLFGPSLSSGAEIFLPSYSNWTEDLQQRWSEWAAPTYSGAIKVATAEDVQNIVRNFSINQT